jgi:Rhodopirellula transposase DDE domain
MGADDVNAAVLAGKFAEMRGHLNERSWRLYLGSEARALAELGDCGLAAAVSVVAAAAGVSRATVSAGAGELAGGAEPAQGRLRRPGAGRPKAEDAQPGLREALDEVLEAGKRGDPMAAVTWNILSLRNIAGKLAARGFAVKKDAVARMMRADGYSLQGMSRVKEGKQHPDRDAQFGRINDMIDLFILAGQPVISTDTKKKELIGEYGRAGRTWQPRGEPVQVRDHDFPDEDTARICPYGIYDIAANTGFVSVGTSHDTGAFAVNAIRLWWQHEGCLRYRDAEYLLVTCDAGGSNGHRCRLWRQQLTELSQETGLSVIVMHFPPGTSKWNKVEHRLFCHITRTWSQSPLLTLDDAVAGIAAATTGQGLKVTAMRDDAEYPVGTEISDRQNKDTEDRFIDRDPGHGGLCYLVLPRPRAVPEPEPGPAGPDPALTAALAALAGIPGLQELRERAALDWTAAREHQLTLKRGGTRRRAGNAGGYRGSGYGKLSEQAILAAAACHIRLGMTWALLGRLYGVHHSSISVPAAGAITILGKHGITRQPGDPRITTPGRLLEHAAAAGITLTIPDTAPGKNGNRHPEDTRDTPETDNLKTDASIAPFLTHDHRGIPDGGITRISQVGRRASSLCTMMSA